MVKISASELNKIMQTDASGHVDAVNDALVAANCNTVNRTAMFLAQTGHESGGLRYFTEISNGLYLRGRKDLGHGPNEGEQWRGRGPIQLTGKVNYRSFGKWCKSRSLVSDEEFFVKNPTKVAEPKWGWLAASWYWTVARPQINSLCDNDDLIGVTKAINGGTNGLEDRRQRYNNAKQVIKNKGESMITKPSPGRRGDPVWLPEVLRLFGLTVNERAGWKDWGHGDFDDIQGVINHHTAGPNTTAEFIALNPGIVAGQKCLSSQMHLARNGVITLCGAGIAYHAGAGEGSTWPGDVMRKSNGVNKWFSKLNAVTLGIEAVNAGDGSQPWPEVQLDAYARANAAICWYLALPVSKVLGHKEVAPSRKIDPNFDMNAMRKRTLNYIQNPPFKEEQVADLFGKEQVGALHEAKIAAQQALEIAKRMERDVDLILDQLVGPARNKQGAPTFTGWRGDAAWEGTRGATSIQDIIVRLSSIENQVKGKK